MNLKSKLQNHLRDQRHSRLLKAARGGNEEACVRLYRELYDPVAAYLERRCSQPQDAEDLIATVFHRFLQNLARFDPQRGSVVAWVMTMARHTLIDHLRRARPTLSVDDLAEQLAGPSPDPLNGLIRTEEADRVLRLVAELPAVTREIFALRYGQGLRNREIGDLLGMEEDAVRQRFSRAHRELRQRLLVQSDPTGDISPPREHPELPSELNSELRRRAVGSDTG